jgi:hypothetical protein
MQLTRGLRKMLVTLALLLVTSLVASSLEAKSSNSDVCQTHHCMPCHTTQHAATPPAPAAHSSRSAPRETRCVVESTTVYTESFARLIDPPPKFLA